LANYSAWKKGVKVVCHQMRIFPFNRLGFCPECATLIFQHLFSARKKRDAKKMRQKRLEMTVDMVFQFLVHVQLVAL
jgi:hypothetical protein